MKEIESSIAAKKKEVGHDKLSLMVTIHNFLLEYFSLSIHELLRLHITHVEMLCR